MTPFLVWFEETKKLYGFCPCCGELFRLSDVTVFTKSPPPRTEFDHVANRQQLVRARIASFDERESAIREEAKIKGQRKARRRLRRLSPYFLGQAIEPQDVKLLFHPVEYLVFRGLTVGKCTSVEFVDRPPETRDREKLQQSLDRAICGGNFEWQTFRVDQDGRVVSDPTRSTPRRGPRGAPARPASSAAIGPQNAHLLSNPATPPRLNNRIVAARVATQERPDTEPSPKKLAK